MSLCAKRNSLPHVHFTTREKIKGKRKRKSWKTQVPSYTFFSKENSFCSPAPCRLAAWEEKAVRGTRSVWNKVTHLLAFCCTASIPRTRRIACFPCSLVLRTRLQAHIYSPTLPGPRHRRTQRQGVPNEKRMATCLL